MGSGLSVVCCALCVACCALSDVCCLLSVVCCLLSVVCCLLSVVCCLLCAVCCVRGWWWVLCGGQWGFRSRWVFVLCGCRPMGPGGLRVWVSKCFPCACVCVGDLVCGPPWSPLTPQPIYLNLNLSYECWKDVPVALLHTSDGAHALVGTTLGAVHVYGAHALGGWVCMFCAMLRSRLCCALCCVEPLCTPPTRRAPLACASCGAYCLLFVRMCAVLFMASLPRASACVCPFDAFLCCCKPDPRTAPRVLVVPAQHSLLRHILGVLLPAGVAAVATLCTCNPCASVVMD